MSEDVPAQLTEFRAGSVVAGYRLERQVAVGGMAVVFRARDERLGRPVALKILSPTLASGPEFRTRFIAESQAAAAVDDPHIIPVYEAGEADGVLFIAMRFVAGGDLRQVLEREGALLPDRAAEFVSPVASALDAAHDAGLVHRDVKPGNILVDTRPGRPDHVYLSDFGIVRRVAAERLTRIGVNMGTPDYMAPEQIHGRDVDGRADQYSLACVTFQLLTGAVPFERDQDLALIYAHLSTPPPSLVARRPDLPAAVDQVVAKAMAKTAEKRYETCGDFADALREALGLVPYHRRSSTTLPPYPPPSATSPDELADLTTDSVPGSRPPGAAKTQESAVPDYPGAATGKDPGPSPWTAMDVPDESLRPVDTAVITDSESVTWPSETPTQTTAGTVASVPDGSLPDEAGMPAEAVHADDSRGEVDENGRTTSPAGEGLPAATAAAVADSQLAGDPSPSQIPSPAARLSESPAFGTIEEGTASPAAAAVAVNGLPPAATTAATDHPLAGSLGVAAGSGGSTVELGRLTVPASGGEGAPTAQRPPRRRGPVAAWIRRHRLPVFALACATLAAAVTLPLISPSRPSSAGQSSSAGSSNSGSSNSAGPSNSSSPAATGTGLVSLGNLSENPSPVDVYLYPSGGSSPQFVEHGVAYGTILPYQPVYAGDYSVQVRAAGSSASSNPVWSVNLTVQAGGVYTVAPLRATAQRGQLRVIDNNLTAPAGKSFVRVIQADLNQGRVTFHCSCAPGAPGNITTDAAPGTVSMQAAIPAGTWTMTAIGPTAKASRPVTLTAGSVHTEIVISKPGGGIEIINLVDAVPSYQRVPVDLPDSRNIPITSVAFSRSGATLAIASAQICLWDIAATGCTSRFGTASVDSIAFSPDGRTLAAGDRSGNTYLWNVLTTTQSAPFTDPDRGVVLSVAFSRDGKILAAGDGNGRTYLWNVATRQLIHTLQDPANTDGVSSVAFSPDGKILAAGGSNGTYLWNVATGKPIVPLPDSGSKGVLSVAFSPDGKILVAGDGNGRTYLWNAATAKLIAFLPDLDSNGIISVACSPDNTTMAAGGNNGRIYLWNIITRKPITTLTDPNNVEIDSAAFSANGQELAIGDQGGGVFLWDIRYSA